MKLGKFAIAVFLGSTAMSVTASPAQAQAQSSQSKQVTVNVPAGDLVSGLRKVARQARVEIIFNAAELRGLRTAGVSGTLSINEALSRLVAGSGARMVRDPSGAFLVSAVGNGGSTSEGDSAGPALDRGSEEIVVTGTSLRGVQPAGSPVIQIDRRQIEASGLATTQDVIRTLPQNFSGGASESTIFSVRDGSESNISAGAGVNLRGLGNDSTLVLVNGQRIAPGGANGAFVDISMIPVSAIARIDVLTDSASAIYGSDAIGGVINIILDEHYSGFETGIRTSFATQGGAETMQASQSAGTEWDSGRASIHYEYRWQDRVDVSQRRFSSSAVGPTDLLPRQERHSIFATASQNIGDRGRLFAHGLMSFSDAEYTLNNPRALDNRQFDSVSSARQFSGSLGFATPAVGDLMLDGSVNYSRMRSYRDRFRGGAKIGFNDLLSQVGSANLKLSGGIFELPAGTANSAVGVEYRRETFFNRAQQANTGIAAPHQSRNVTAAYGEIYLPLVASETGVPLVRELSISAAARYERYSDVGSAFSPRIGVDWAPIEGLKLRGSVGNSFRAPLLSELDPSIKQALLIFLPNAASPTGETLTLVPSSAPASDLGPERALIWSVGADVEPSFVPGLRMSVTYFNIDFKDRIAVVDGLFEAFLDPALAPLITRSPTAAEIADATSNLGFPLDNFTSFQPQDAEAIFDQRTLNIARTRSEGIDASVAYDRSFGDTHVALSANMAFMLRREDQITDVSHPIDTAGTIFNPADFKLRTGLTFARKQVSFSIFANHVGSYVDDQTPVRSRIPSWTTFDANLSYAFPADAVVLGGLRISFAVQNVFDHDPPFVVDLGNSAQSLGYDPTNASPLGRVINISLRKTW